MAPSECFPQRSPSRSVHLRPAAALCAAIPSRRSPAQVLDQAYRSYSLARKAGKRDPTKARGLTSAAAQGQHTPDVEEPSRRLGVCVHKPRLPPGLRDCPPPRPPQDETFATWPLRSWPDAQFLQHQQGELRRVGALAVSLELGVCTCATERSRWSCDNESAKARQQARAVISTPAAAPPRQQRMLLSGQLCVVDLFSCCWLSFRFGAGVGCLTYIKEQI